MCLRIKILSIMRPLIGESTLPLLSPYIMILLCDLQRCPQGILMYVEVIIPHLNVCIPLSRFLMFGLLPHLHIITSHFLKLSVLTYSITVLLPHSDSQGQERSGNFVPRSPSDFQGWERMPHWPLKGAAEQTWPY